MIRVNLLPLERRPIRHSLVPYVLSVTLLIAGLIAMGAVYAATQTEVLQRRGELRRNQEALAELADIIEESNQLERMKAGLATKIDTIVEITADRILWSRELWNLSRLAPANIWYREIKVDAKSFREQRMEYNPQTKKQERKTVTVTRPILQVSGYVAPADDGGVDVNPFIHAVENDAEFASMFELEPPSFGDDVFENVPVRSFILEFVIKTGETAE